MISASLLTLPRFGLASVKFKTTNADSRAVLLIPRSTGKSGKGGIMKFSAEVIALRVTGVCN